MCSFQTMKRMSKKDESVVMAWLDEENSLEISKSDDSFDETKKKSTTYKIGT